jgi:hypothetical protein
VVLFVLISADLSAQTSFGTIAGRVTDSTGAIIAKATVVVTNSDTSVSRKTVTDGNGNYQVESLPPGRYQLQVTNVGFQTANVTDLVLDVARTVTSNVALSVGTVAENVTVAATDQLLDTTDATVGTEIDTNEIVTIPLNGRNYTDLIALTPGAVPRGVSSFQVAGGNNYSIGGASPDQNNFSLDGIQNNDIFFESFSLQPSIDALQEFRVQNDMSSAEYANSSANVNASLKSGTNKFHGTLWEFVRNDLFDAPPYFDDRNGLTKAPYRQNQWGFVFDGPVVIPKLYNGHDKLFWMFNYEGLSIREGEIGFATVPTQTELTGDLRDLGVSLYDPTSTHVDPATGKIVRNPIQCNGVINVICPTSIDPAMAEIASLEFPNVSKGGVNNVIDTNSLATDAIQFNTRIDYHIGDKVQMYGHFARQHADQAAPGGLPNLYTTTNGWFYNTMAGVVFEPNTSTVIDGKFGYNRSDDLQISTNPGIGAVAFFQKYPLEGLAVQYPQYPLLPNFGMNGYSTFSFPGNIEITNDWEAIFNYSKTWGRHTFKTGYSQMHEWGLHDNPNSNSVTYGIQATGDPQNPATTGSGLASFLMGYPTAANDALGNTAYNSLDSWYDGYFQDAWRVNSKLVLNLGLRYGYDEWPREKYGRISEFDFEKNEAVWAATNPITGAPANISSQLRNPDWTDFAPRTGLSYSLNPKTTFRLGYGMFFMTNYLWQSGGNTRGQWPFAVTQSVSALNYGQNTIITPVETALPQQSLTPDPSATPPPIGATIWTTDKHGYSQQWNAGIQRQLTEGLMLEVNYVGTKGTKLPVFFFGNTPLPGPGTLGSPTHPWPNANNPVVTLISKNLGSSIYEGLQVKATKRMSHGLQFLASYAWAHDLDIGGSGQTTQSFIQDDNNIKADKGDSQLDYRHIFHVGYTYDLPLGAGRQFLSGAHGVLQQVVGGWEVAGLTGMTSGAPVNVAINFDNANTGDPFNERPDFHSGLPNRVPVSGDPTQGWLNPAEFYTVQYTYGNLQRDNFRGPNYYDWDISGYKDFLLHEPVVLQFRSEFYNAFNQVDLGSPAATFGNPGFGTITSTANNNREIQFALKLKF